MLYIEDYHNALRYHQKVLSCWLKIKIHGISKTGRKCNYCGNEECKSKGIKEHQFKFSQEAKSFFTREVLDGLLIGIPSDLLKIAKSYKNNTTFIADKPEIEKLFKESGYKNYYQKKYGKEFLDLLNRSTCTYCNRNYTLNVSAQHASAQLDHWIPKTFFPIFSLSFFNLIPSCGSCNHIKGQSDKKDEWWAENALKELVHPYFPESSESFKFDFVFGKTTNEFEVTFRDVIGDKISETLKFNFTREAYQAHSQLELKDLYNLRKKYTTNYIKFLLEKLHELEPSEDEKYRMLFGIEKNPYDYHKRPLSKFKNDIIEKLLSIS